MNRGKYLREKISVPQVSHQLLRRKDIYDIINSAVLDEAVCFIAPYGYGKTLAVVSWLRECGKDAAWITLDSSDNSEQVLFAGLSAAIMRFCGWQGDQNNILSDPKYIENPHDFLWDAISKAENIIQERILVIDNLRFIQDHDLLRAIKNLIADLLGSWRVIIMCRVELPPVFTELILKGRVRLVAPKELRFSIEEMEEFFAINGCYAERDDLLSIMGETAGWPASLNVVLTISRGGPVIYGEAVRAYLIGFFETEVWDELNEDIKVFLLKTSILDKLTPAACRSVTGTGEALSLLRWLFANGLFISRLNERNTYCYYRAFRDFLMHKLESSEIDGRELYKKYAWWLFDNDEMTRSFTFFFKAGDLYGIDQVLKILNLADIGIDGFLKLTDCITTLNITDLKSYPVIVARMAFIHFLKGNIAGMQSLYRRLLEWGDPGIISVSPEEYGEYVWEIGWLCYLDPDEPTSGNQKHIEHGNYRYYAPHRKELHIGRIAALSFPSYFRGLRDYGDDGIFETESILKRVEQGEKYILDEEEAVWDTYLILAEYKYELEEFEQAEEIIRRVMTMVEDRRYAYLYFICTSLLVKLIRAVHNPKEIDALTARLETIITSNEKFFLLPNFHAFELRNLLAGGHIGFTEVFENENRDYEDKPYFVLLYRHITFVRGLLSTGDYNRAMLILGNLELLCQKYKRPTDLIEVNILKAAAFCGLEYEDAACQSLISALGAAERYGYIRIFSDDAKLILPVLELVYKKKKSKYIQKIIISCKKTLVRSGIKPPAKKYAHTELTKTELATLKAIQSGMSYAEIAHDKGVSVSTVKSHLHSVYSKLDVNNKTAAIIVAREMGILD